MTTVAVAAPALDPERDTFPKLVRQNAERFPGKVAIREKDLGIWQSYTWRDIVLDGDAQTISENEDIKEFYLGLSGVGERKSYRDTKHYRRRKRWLS